MRRRALCVWFGTIALVVALGGCSRETEEPAAAKPDATAAEETSPVAPTVPAVTAADLSPTFQTEGPDERVPQEVTIQFARPIVAPSQVGRAPVGGTVVRVRPATEGSLRYTGPSTLVFSPKSGFAPGTSYEIALEAVETDSGLVAAPSASAWAHRFTTPEFRFLRMDFVKADPRGGTAELNLAFSAPVHASALEDHAAFALVRRDGSEGPLPRVRLVPGRDRHIVRAVVSSRDLFPGRRLRLILREGLPMAGNASHRAARATAEVELERLDAAEILAVYPAEGANGHYIEVVCDDHSVKEKRYFHGGGRHYRDLSRRCQPLEADAQEGIGFEPEVSFSVAPSGGGFKIFGDFGRGTYAMRIGAGLRTVDGGVLGHEHVETISIPARTPQVSFVSKGRYLPRGAWRSLAVHHLNVDRVELTVRHVPAKNLVFWMSDSANESATERTSNLIARKTVPLQGQPDTMTTSYVDVASLVTGSSQGLFEVRVAGANAFDTVRLVLTDLYLVAKRGWSDSGKPWGNRVHAWALDVNTLDPVPGTQLKLLRKSGQFVASCVTDPEGGCALDVPEEGLDPSPPFALVATRDDDLTYLKFADVKAEVQDAQISGEAYGGERAYRAAVYTDRGVYRPGETAHIVGIVRDRDNLAPPEGMPVVVKLIDPRGKTIRQSALVANAAGFLTLDVEFPAFATTGRYEARLEVATQRIGGNTFQVEEFVPERMQVRATPGETAYLRGDEVKVDVSARYLFGGVPADHRVELTCEIEPASFEPEEKANFHYGVWSEDDAPSRPLALGSVSGSLDDEGAARLACPGESWTAGFGGPARLVARAAVFESGSGRTTVGRGTAPVHPERFYIGLSSGTTKVEAGSDLAVDGVIVDWEGKLDPSVDEVRIEWVRLEIEYGWYHDERTGRGTYRQYLRPVTEEKTAVKVNDGKFHLVFRPTRDARGFLVRASAGGARTDLEFEGKGYWYYWGSGRRRVDRTPPPGKAAWLALDAPEQIRVGETVGVALEAPYRGRMLFTVETDRLVASQWKSIEAGPVHWSFRLAEFVPNVYVTALLVKDPHLDSAEAFLPDRAFGVRPVGVKPEEFIHPVSLEVPNEVRSNSTLRVRLDLGPVSGPTYATVAAVDEGILSLTGFPSPDPFKDVFARRALGVDTFETVGWTLLLPPGGPSSTTGGDTAGTLGRVQPVKPVALWSGLVEVPPSGLVEVSFDVPQYRGALRVMAVTAGRKKMGRASAQVVVRDPLVAQTTLPRFLTRGDEIQVPVFVTNLSGSERDVSVLLTAENLPVPGLDEPPGMADPVEIVGASTKSLVLADGENGVLVFQAKALRAAGAAKLKVVAASGELQSAEEADVPLLPAGPKTRRVQRIDLAEGVLELTSHLEGWMPLSERSTFWVTGNPYGEAFDHLKYLIRYPYGCIEQTTSSTRPLLFVSSLLHNVDPTLVASERIEDMVIHGVDRVLSMQTPSGGFAYWPGGTEPNPWGTAYATHMLLDAGNQRYSVPQGRLEEALRWMERELDQIEKGWRDQPHRYGRDAEPYMHFVLALGGKARKARIQHLIDGIGLSPRHERIEHAYMLKAALYLAGNHVYERDLRAPDLTPITDYRDNGWSFYSDRRMRGFLLSTFADLFGSDPAGQPLANLVAEGLQAHPSAWYTTQELVWGITGLGKVVEAGAKDFAPPVLRMNGTEVAPQPPPPGQKSSDRTWALARASEYGSVSLEVPEKREGRLYLILSSEGVREVPDYRTGGEGLRIRRRFLDPAGSPIRFEAGSHSLGDMVFVELTVTNTSPERIQNIALVDRLPAGWEIENPRLGRAGGIEWIDAKGLWEADHMDLRDDRVEVFGHLERTESKRVVYAVRAVTAGRFTIPPVEAEAMYDPRIWAREDGQVIDIAGPWAQYL